MKGVKLDMMTEQERKMIHLIYASWDLDKQTKYLYKSWHYTCRMGHQGTGNFTFNLANLNYLIYLGM